jgi:hypothetical protein
VLLEQAAEELATLVATARGFTAGLWLGAFALGSFFGRSFFFAAGCLFAARRTAALEELAAAEELTMATAVTAAAAEQAGVGLAAKGQKTQHSSKHKQLGNTDSHPNVPPNGIN